MPTQRDVYMAANMTLKQHGIEAAIFAAINADRLAERGDRPGPALWISVIKEIEVLEARVPTAGHSVQ